MNERRGGLLAMGDHDYLGASMCHRIPRIRSMRRWTNAQGVPPIGGQFQPDTHLRHDTNQPATPGELAGTAEIPFENQEDAVPQKIEWVPWLVQQVSVFKLLQRPHPILCHPTLGPIDVMPDHPHEGWCYEDDEIDLNANYTFNAYSGDEYPKVGGNPHGPTIIAYGNTTPDPPYQLEKGDSPKKRFGMISVYDGHPASVGRVVTDSTWHHWFDENIHDIEVAGVQEYRRDASVFDLGKPLHTYLKRKLGPCWVSRWLFDNLQLVDDDLWAYLKDRLFWKKGWPGPGDPCLSCPPFDLLEIAALGGLVRATFPVADRIKESADRGKGRMRELEVEELTKLQHEGIRIGLDEFRGRLARSMEEMQRAFSGKR